MTEGSFEGVEGVKIFTREWQPAGEPRGVVVISVWTLIWPLLCMGSATHGLAF